MNLSNETYKSLKTAFGNINFFAKSNYILVNSPEKERIQKIVESVGFCPLILQDLIEGKVAFTISPYELPKAFIGQANQVNISKSKRTLKNKKTHNIKETVEESGGSNNFSDKEFLLHFMQSLKNPIKRDETTKLTLEQAKVNLSQERKIWERFQKDRTQVWLNYETNKTSPHLSTLVKNTIDHLVKDIPIGIAVDLGCGTSSLTAYTLLELGWKVYVVDNSPSIMKALREMAINFGKEKWIEENKLIFVDQSIEKFAFPEQVHLVTATSSLPYCDPQEITNIFLKVKEALLPIGMFACNLFPYTDLEILDNDLRDMFGGWMTTKNVVDTIVNSIGFSSWAVVQGQNGLEKFFNITAQVGL